MSICFYGCVSMDGYLADKSHNLDWLHQTEGAEESGYEEFYRQMDVTLMGRRTFAEIEKLGDASSCYPTTENYVFTHQERLSQKGFLPVCEDVVEFAKRLDRRKKVWVIGGGTLLAPLLDHDMVDALVLQVAPVLLGEGIPLFSQQEAQRRFVLQEISRFGQFARLVYTKEPSRLKTAPESGIV